jgi:plastocyanin
MTSAGVRIGLTCAAWLTTLILQQAHAPGQTGTLEGRVTYSGPAPPPVTVAESGGEQKVLHLDRQGGLRFAVIALPDSRPAAGKPSGESVVDQRGFVFVPQVLAVRAGQLVRFTNSDSANHNVRSRDSNPANAFNLATADSRSVETHRFAATTLDRPVVLSCDIHPWMAAWVYAFDHDAFAVTGPDGAYRIDGLPAGRHRVSVRQPSGRLARELSAEVLAGRATRLDVQFSSGDVGMQR